MDQPVSNCMVSAPIWTCLC